MQLKLANWNQSDELKRFFEKFEFEDTFHYRIRRPRGFFMPYQGLGHDYEVLALHDKQDSLLATATFLYPTFQSSDLKKKHKIAVAHDLRVLVNRQATLGWHQNFIPALEAVKEKHQVDGILSLLSKSDRRVLNTFLRSQPFKRDVPRYYLYQNFKLTTVHGFLPFAKIHLPAIMVRTANDSDLTLIQKFLQEKSWSFLSYLHRVEDIQLLLNNLGLSLSSLWVAENRISGQIEGLFILVPSSRLQEYIPLHYPLRAHNFRQFLKFGRLWGWTHTLTKPLSRTQQEQPLNFFHIGAIRTEHPDIFQFMLQEVWKTLRTDTFLTYLRDKQDLDLNLPTGILRTEMDYDLFAISLPQEPLKPFAEGWENRPFRLDSFMFF